jgi:hypothetical protein
MGIERELETVDSPSTIQPALLNNFGQTRLNFMRSRQAKEEENNFEPLTKKAQKESAFPTFDSPEWRTESDRYSAGCNRNDPGGEAGTFVGTGSLDGFRGTIFM